MLEPSQNLACAISNLNWNLVVWSTWRLRILPQLKKHWHSCPVLPSHQFYLQILHWMIIWMITTRLLSESLVTTSITFSWGKQLEYCLLLDEKSSRFYKIFVWKSHWSCWIWQMWSENIKYFTLFLSFHRMYHYMLGKFTVDCWFWSLEKAQFLPKFASFVMTSHLNLVQAEFDAHLFVKVCNM